MVNSKKQTEIKYDVYARMKEMMKEMTMIRSRDSMIMIYSKYTFVFTSNMERLHTRDDFLTIEFAQKR